MTDPKRKSGNVRGPRRHAGGLAAVLLAAAAGCKGSTPPPARADGGLAMIPADHLIERGEVHFKHLWQVTAGGRNRSPRWSPDGRSLTFQTFDLARGVECDRVAVQVLESGERTQVSSGSGVAAGGSFGARNSVVFASTHGTQASCPPPPDHRAGYVWSLDPEYDVYVADLATGEVRLVASGDGYDAEAIASPTGDGIVFSSSRSGDIELWRCDSEGGELVQLTDSPGYDGAASFDPDGQRIAFHTTRPATAGNPEGLAAYREQLANWTVSPVSTELMVMDADGSGVRQVTRLGQANWTPAFFPDGTRLVFASNHHGEGALATNFDLFAVDLDGTGLERITTFDAGWGKQFDGFPYFSPDGRFLAFSSNRGAVEIGETNVFIAEWQ